MSNTSKTIRIEFYSLYLYYCMVITFGHLLTKEPTETMFHKRRIAIEVTFVRELSLTVLKLVQYKRSEYADISSTKPPEFSKRTQVVLNA